MFKSMRRLLLERNFRAKFEELESNSFTNFIELRELATAHLDPDFYGRGDVRWRAEAIHASLLLSLDGRELSRTILETYETLKAEDEILASQIFDWIVYLSIPPFGIGNSDTYYWRRYASHLLHTNTNFYIFATRMILDFYAVKFLDKRIIDIVTKNSIFSHFSTKLLRCLVGDYVYISYENDVFDMRVPPSEGADCAIGRAMLIWMDYELSKPRGLQRSEDESTNEFILHVVEYNKMFKTSRDISRRDFLHLFMFKNMNKYRPVTTRGALSDTITLGEHTLTPNSSFRQVMIAIHDQLHNAFKEYTGSRR